MPLDTPDRGTFIYQNPARIAWGDGCVAERLPAEMERLGVSRAFLVTTRSVGAHPDLGGALADLLGDRLVGRYDGISQHTPAATAAAAVDAARQAQPDVLVSLGGGSAVDAAKVVAFALATGLDVAAPDAPRQARRLPLADRQVLPHLTIPTTLSTAEMGRSAGLTLESTREKSGLVDWRLLPDVVFYDAAYAVHTPLWLWLSTGLRAVDHAVESLLAPERNPHSDALALDALRRLPPALRACKADPADRAARTAAQLGAWLSDSLSVPASMGLSHILGKRIGSVHDIPHGVTSCLLLPHVMRARRREPGAPAILARVARALDVDTSGMDEDAAALAAADAVAALVAELDLPRHIADFRLTESDLAEAARPVASATYPETDLVAIYRAAW